MPKAPLRGGAFGIGERCVTDAMIAQSVIVYAIVEMTLSRPNFPLGAELAAKLKISERELEAGELN